MMDGGRDGLEKTGRGRVGYGEGRLRGIKGRKELEKGGQS